MLVRTPQAYDTTTLNYNWQIWDTQAFSLYSTSTDCIDQNAAQLAVESILRFMSVKGLLHRAYFPAAVAPKIFRESCLHTILSHEGGLLLCRRKPGDAVSAGELLGEILDPCSCQTLEQLKAGCSGRVFFSHRSQLLNGHEVAFRILPETIAG